MPGMNPPPKKPAHRDVDRRVDCRVNQGGGGGDDSREAVCGELSHFQNDPCQRRDPHDAWGVLVDVHDPHRITERVEDDRPVKLVVFHPVRAPLPNIAVPHAGAGQLDLGVSTGVDAVAAAKVQPR